MKNTIKPVESVLVKPAGPDCNLGCTYCFYLEKADLFKDTVTHRMSDEVLEQLVKQVLSQPGKNLSFTWQGGEPTLMGLEFFEKAVRYQQKYGRGKIVGNGLQTNGLLINEKWVDFLKQYNFLIGLSLDGPRHVHDHYRLTQSGRPSWDRVMQSARLLLSRGVAVNAMCCITSYSSGFATEIYNFYKQLGFEWMQFIPVVETDKDNPRIAADFSVTDEQYGRFLIEIFDLWHKDFRGGKPTTNIRFIESIFHTYVGIPAPDCTMQKECGVYLTVEHNGNVYSCDFFVEPQWRLGNVKSDRLLDMLNSKRQNQFGAIKANIPAKCRTCKWYNHCFAGCPKDRIKDKRDGGMPRFCKSQIMLLEHTDHIFRKLAKEWVEEQKVVEKKMQEKDVWKDYFDF
jgi:uncharacterized protein